MSTTPPQADLLIELLTEELPPKALRRLGESFATQITQQLKAAGLVAAGVTETMYATPRRLAVLVPGVISQATDRTQEVKGPSVKVGLDDQGQPTQALLKWAEKQSVPVDSLRRAGDGKQESFFASITLKGVALGEVIQGIIEGALAKLPIPKLMEYQLADGITSVSFVRPAHGLVVLHGQAVLPATVLGIPSGRQTRGHRFQSEGLITLPQANEYEAALQSQGNVIASFDARKQLIESSLRAQALALQASLGDEAAVAPLLEEVTALVERPCVYVGAFETEFLQVPQECLILTMRTNQKYFPLFDAAGKLLPRFLIVSNMQVADPSFIIDGNERVVRPRLADARFFFEQDRKVTLASRVGQLASVIYHARLGTQAQRSERVQAIVRGLALALKIDPALAERAAWLAKADLLSGMVGEFPELQGIMGRYYAGHDGEPAEVAQAIAEQYQPRFAGDALPATATGTLLALADKLETLAGLFGIGQVPTGDRDPFALRRHALGVIRLLIEKQLAVRLDELLTITLPAFGHSTSAEPPAFANQLQDFIWERLRSYLREQGHSAIEIASVVDSGPQHLALVPAQLKAVRAFAILPEALALAAANKRIGNILRKAETPVGRTIDAALLTEPAEKDLAAIVAALTPEVDAKMAAFDFTGALTVVAQARDAVDRFFDDVMVMAEDPAVRNNRLALLANLSRLMNQVADISKLSAA